MAILGALIGAGASLIGSAMQNRQNKQAQQRQDQLAQQSRAELNQFQNQYGGTYDSTIARGTAGETMYDNSMGLNGAAGNAAALNTYQQGPGVQFALGQAQQATERGAAAGGYLASGNLQDQLMRNAMGYANQDFGAWQDRLGGYNNLGMAGREGKAALGSLVATGKMNLNNQQSDMLQGQMNNRQQTMGTLGNLAGRFLGSAGVGSGQGGFLGTGYSAFK